VAQDDAFNVLEHRGRVERQRVLCTAGHDDLARGGAHHAHVGVGVRVFEDGHEGGHDERQAEEQDAHDAGSAEEERLEELLVLRGVWCALTRVHTCAQCECARTRCMCEPST